MAEIHATCARHGTIVDRYGQPMTIKLSGPVEPYFRDAAE